MIKIVCALVILTAGTAFGAAKASGELCEFLIADGLNQRVYIKNGDFSGKRFPEPSTYIGKPGPLNGGLKIIANNALGKLVLREVPEMARFEWEAAQSSYSLEHTEANDGDIAITAIPTFNNRSSGKAYRTEFELDYRVLTKVVFPESPEMLLNAQIYFSSMENAKNAVKIITAFIENHPDLTLDIKVNDNEELAYEGSPAEPAILLRRLNLETVSARQLFRLLLTKFI